MNKTPLDEGVLKKLWSRLLAALLKSAKTVPSVRKRIEGKYDGIMEELKELVKPHTCSSFCFSRIPEKGIHRETILAEMEKLTRNEESRWRDGFVSGAVYHGDQEHIGFLNRVYNLSSQSNPLHSDVWPSTVKYEAEIVAMTARMLGSQAVDTGTGERVCGTVTTGGTESILLAVKTYRDRARRERGIGFHTDACLGGFVLPWAERLGYRVEPFDFRLPGVSSISVDTHKYGYAAKGSSVILYRSKKLRRYQYFKITEWPGGLYFSPTTLGSRPGELIASCWASLVSTGESGYLAATKRILETAERIKKGIAEIPELFVLGNPLWVIAFGSKTLDVYRINKHMARKEWNLNGLHKPPCLHLCVTLRHTDERFAERFIQDLTASVEKVKTHPKQKYRMAPVYGMAATFPDRSAVADLLDRYMDLLYEV